MLNRFNQFRTEAAQELLDRCDALELSITRCENGQVTTSFRMAGGLLTQNNSPDDMDFILRLAEEFARGGGGVIHEHR